MKQGKRVGRDELMIVNPGLPPSRATFLGEDGVLYQLLDWVREEELGQVVLGENGTLYRLQTLNGLPASAVAFGRFFLGEDGTLYEIVGSSWR